MSSPTSLRKRTLAPLVGGRCLRGNRFRRRNAFGILSEDIHPQTGALWGNLPQTYSMAGVINSAMNLSRGWEEAWSPNEDIATPPGRHPREGNGP